MKPEMLIARFIAACFLGVLTLCPGCLPTTQKQDTAETNRIHIWYGPEQHFGQNGQPQRWINVLGNIADSAKVKATCFSLNGGEERPFTLGGDLHRLAVPGDFNVELSWEEVNVGENELKIQVEWEDKTSESSYVKLIVEKGKTWPLPYEIDFSNVEDLQKLVQVVDGHWKREADGVRTVQRYYDRVLTMGDTTWVNYEAKISLTIHDFTTPEKGPPTFDVTHFGVAQRWRGHHSDGRQPSRKWYPLGAQGEFMVKTNLDSCRWRILFGGGKEAPPQVWSPNRKSLELNKAIFVKSQVQSLSDGRIRYRYKLWPKDVSEPTEWDIEGTEIADTGYPSGALCLVPHNTDVTIHSISVKPL